MTVSPEELPRLCDDMESCPQSIALKNLCQLRFVLGIIEAYCLARSPRLFVLCVPSAKSADLHSQKGYIHR